MKCDQEYRLLFPRMIFDNCHEEWEGSCREAANLGEPRKFRSVYFHIRGYELGITRISIAALLFVGSLRSLASTKDGLVAVRQSLWSRIHDSHAFNGGPRDHIFRVRRHAKEGCAS